MCRLLGGGSEAVKLLNRPYAKPAAALAVAGLLLWSLSSVYRTWESARPLPPEQFAIQSREVGPDTTPGTGVAVEHTPDFAEVRLLLNGQDVREGAELTAGEPFEAVLTVAYSDGADRRPPGGGLMYDLMMLRAVGVADEWSEAKRVCEKPFWPVTTSEQAAVRKKYAAAVLAGRSREDLVEPGFTASASGVAPERAGRWNLQIWRYDLAAAAEAGRGAPSTTVLDTLVDVR